MTSTHAWHFRITSSRLGLLLAVACLLALGATPAGTHPAEAAGPVGTAFVQASRESGVPVPVLQGICYLEGRLSAHGGTPSIDGGYGCMHLVKNRHADTLDRAAGILHVPAAQLQTDLVTNIRGGAAVLRVEALALGGSNALPATLADWYGAVAAYSHATTRSTALMYADALYRLLATGFSGQADDGETVTLPPQAVTPNRALAPAVRGATPLPAGCSNDGNVDFPGAIDCIVPDATFDCNLVPAVAPCSYNGANRPADFAITQVVVHDVEGTVQDALSVFQDPNNFVSVQYVIDTDGTIYQTLHEKDVPFAAGNLWYNEHTVNIEHAGFDATGFLWYNATQYLASARLMAHLLTTYGIPLDHDHVIGHSDVPGPSLAHTPNHVDPGPYWLWAYYFGLIHQQGVPLPRRGRSTSSRCTRRPSGVRWAATAPRRRPTSTSSTSTRGPAPGRRRSRA